MFGWISERRRRRILAQPFPDEWLRILSKNVPLYATLSEAERQTLRDLVQVFLAEKAFEGCGGLELDDEIRVTIAGHACLLLLGLDHGLYASVETILVYPSGVVPKRVEEPMFARPDIVRPIVPVIGEAHQRGPIILSWDSVRSSGRALNGHNVVYHEFAHKIDMADGGVDGVPPVSSRAEYRRWVEICTREYEALRAQLDRGEPTFLDAYAGTDVGEFFAVCTEHFFEEPLAMRDEHPELYAVFRDFYRQDPAERLAAP